MNLDFSPVNSKCQLYLIAKLFDQRRNQDHSVAFHHAY